jgi:DNA-directed RNA polymerase subunit beta
MAIEREEIERLAKDRDDEQAILDRNVYGRLRRHAGGKTAIAGPKGFKKGAEDHRSPCRIPRSQWWQLAVEDEKLQGEIEAPCRSSTTIPRSSLGTPLRWTRSRRSSAATNCRRA